MTKELKIQKAKEILEKNNIDNIKICNYGIYRQYELAGEKVDTDVFDNCDLEENEVEVFDGKDKYDAMFDEKQIPIEDINELRKLFSFVNRKYIYNTLGFDDEGQYCLLFKKDGTFDFVYFTI